MDTQITTKIKENTIGQLSDASQLTTHHSNKAMAIEFPLTSTHGFHKSNKTSANTTLAKRCGGM